MTNIVTIDDDVGITKIYQVILGKKEGHSVRSYASYEELIEAKDYNADIYIMDFDTGKMSGGKFIEQNPDLIPVNKRIYCTAGDGYKDGGFSGISLPKPFNMKDLITTVDIMYHNNSLLENIVNKE